MPETPGRKIVESPVTTRDELESMIAALSGFQAKRRLLVQRIAGCATLTKRAA
jgi:hypothetical protein